MLLPPGENCLGSDWSDLGQLFKLGLTRTVQIERTLPIRRAVTSRDVANFAVHLMTNTAVTGGTFEIDGGQQLVER